MQTSMGMMKYPTHKLDPVTMPATTFMTSLNTISVHQVATRRWEAGGRRPPATMAAKTGKPCEALAT